MPSTFKKLFSWSDSINALEAIKPLAFRYFYDFHSIHGLRERNLSPNKRLVEIGNYCESASESLTDDFFCAITEHFSIDECNIDYFCVSDEGFHFF
jgi:hypothetical protein